jgi:integrase
MKMSDVDRTNPKTWVYRLKHHKTARYDKRRIITFGREEQSLLLPYLDKEPSAAVFSPKDAVAEHKKLLRNARVTPIKATQKRDEQRKRHPKARIKEHFDTPTVGKALKKTILKANRELSVDQQIPHWTLYQLRHAFLTEMTERHDENIAALLAGHSDPKMVRRIYDHSQERRIKRLKQEHDKHKDVSTGLTETEKDV